MLIKRVLGLVEMTCGLVHTSYSLPEGKAVKLALFAACMDSIYLPSLSVFCHGFTTSYLVMPYWHFKNTILLCIWSFVVNTVQLHNLYLPILIYQSCLFLLWRYIFLFILIMIKQSLSPRSCFEMIIINVGMKFVTECYKSDNF